MARLVTTSGDLARRGFARPAVAAEQLEALLERNAGRGPAWDPGAGWLDVFDHAPDPDLALAGLNRIDAENPARLDCVSGDRAAFTRLVSVLGGSTTLNQHLCLHPHDIGLLVDEPRRWSADEIRADFTARLGVDLTGADPAPSDAAADTLRLANKSHLVRIAGRDLTADDPEAGMEGVAGELADLADAIVAGALAVARREVPGHERVRFGVVALGKCGAQELNYISDIDVIYVAEPADEQTTSEQAVAIGVKMAAAMARTCSTHSSAGSIWQLDANLRPDGKSGPLVRTLSSMAAYYAKWAKNWEFQAMLKSRPMAGDLALAQDFCELVNPLVWTAAERENFLADTQAMRRRVIALLPAKEENREIKLGAGGLRDVEFTVQLLQLVHGRADDRVRTRATLPGLRALVQHGYISRSHGAELEAAYRFERTLEHRIQLQKLRRSHLLPDDDASLRVIARGMRAKGPTELVERFRQTQRRVLRLHQQVFYSPLLAAVTRISTDELKLTTEQAQDRLRVLGFHDPAAALRHIEALTNGVSRAAEIQRQLMPAMLGWFAQGPNPDHGLLAFRHLSESLGSSPWYLRALRDEGEMAERLARLLSSSRWAVDLLERSPESSRMLADTDELVPRSRDDLATAMVRAAGRHSQDADAIDAVRALRRQELLRLVMGDLLGIVELDQLGRGLADLAGATIDGALQIVARGVHEPPRLAVVAMGRWGGGEMGLGSDCDAMFVIADSDDPQATRKAEKMVTRLRAMLAQKGPDPALPIDIDLRPEGKNGPVVRMVSSMAAYYARHAQTWERQALVRAAHGAGDEQVSAEVLALADHLRWSPEGLTKAQLTEIRKLKARMETERMPRGQDARRNTKLGPGGLSDVEWTVQVLQLEHAGSRPELRTPSTMQALAAEVAAGLVCEADADELVAAWRLASRIRNAVMLVRGRPSDALPSDNRELAAVASLLGHRKGESSVLLDDWLRTSRRASQVVERLFWGREPRPEPSR